MNKAETNAEHRERERKKRQELLTMEPARLLLKTALPLLMYSCIQIAFQFFDVLTVANISRNMVSTVLLAGDLQMIFNMIFISASVAVGIRISHAFGAGDMKQIRRDISTVFFLTLFIVSLVLGITLPASPVLLRLCAFPEELISSGSVYFSISMVSLFFNSINQVYFATEKARGNTRLVSRCNMISLIVKVLLNAVILYLVRHSLVDLSVVAYLLPAASCAAQAAVSAVSFHGFFSRKSMFRVHWKDTTFTRTFFKDFAKLSLPLIAERVLISSAKTICNGFYAVFGSPGLAAFACSGRIASLITMPLTSFQDAETTVTAVNLGNRRYDRVEVIFRKTALIIFTVAAALFTAVWLASGHLIAYFAKGDAQLAENIARIYSIQRWDFVFVAIDSICCGCLYAMKKTKLPTIVNFIKLFVVRIPLFLLMTRILGMGIEAIAWAILLSNMFDAVMSVFFLIRGRRSFAKAVRQEESANSRLRSAIQALGRLDAFDWQPGKGTAGVPGDLMLTMRESMGGTLTEQEMTEAYRYALVEARIDELEKTERME